MLRHMRGSSTTPRGPVSVSQFFCAVHERVPRSVGEHDKAARVANRGEFIEATKVRALCRGGPMTKIGIAARQGG
jgi:hypothetical protein